MDKISEFVIGGERAGNFNPEARVWGEMAVRVIVLRVLQSRGGLTPIAAEDDCASNSDGDDAAEVAPATNPATARN